MNQTAQPPVRDIARGRSLINGLPDASVATSLLMTNMMCFMSAYAQQPPQNPAHTYVVPPGLVDRTYRGRKDHHGALKARMKVSTQNNKRQRRHQNTAEKRELSEVVCRYDLCRVANFFAAIEH